MVITQESFIDWIKAFTLAISQNKEYLTELDSAIGDADHGINMDRGFQSVISRLPGFQNQDIGSISKNIGMVLISTVGGASGPLYGTFFMQIGTAASGKLNLSLEEWGAAFESAVEGIIRRGKANRGDKTMLDSLLPALDALKAAVTSGASFQDAVNTSENAAREGMLATIPMIAKKGRASYLGERSVGTQDPGATSAYLLEKAAADTWGNLL
jgi:dihydroxyacetone kinase-like protein